MSDNEKQKKRKAIPLDTKVKIARFLNNGGSIRGATKEFCVSKGTVQGVAKNKDALLSAEKQNLNLKLTRLSSSNVVNNLLWRFFEISRSRGFPISGPILKAKALQIHQSLGLETSFTASEGWLDSWKKKYNVVSRAICGESGNDSSGDATCEEDVADGVDGDDQTGQQQPQPVISSTVAQRHLVEIAAFLNSRGMVVEEGQALVLLQRVKATSRERQIQSSILDFFKKK